MSGKNPNLGPVQHWNKAVAYTWKCHAYMYIQSFTPVYMSISVVNQESPRGGKSCESSVILRIALLGSLAFHA